jgi:hypothetical protein
MGKEGGGEQGVTPHVFYPMWILMPKDKHAVLQYDRFSSE